MTLRTRLLRDAKNRFCGTVTFGYSDRSEALRNREGKLIGHVLCKKAIAEHMEIAQKAGLGFLIGHSSRKLDE